MTHTYDHNCTCDECVNHEISLRGQIQIDQRFEIERAFALRDRKQGRKQDARRVSEKFTSYDLYSERGW